MSSAKKTRDAFVPLVGDILPASVVAVKDPPQSVNLGGNFAVLHDVWPKLVALEVRTDQLTPIARAGDLLLFEDLQEEITEAHFGVPVFFKTTRGEYGVRYLHLSERKGLYNLVALGLMATTQMNVRLESVGRLALPVPRELLAKVREHA